MHDKQKEYKKVAIGGIGNYSAEELLKMPLHVVHFNISRMIRDLQYETNGELEDKLKEDNGGKDQLVKEDKIDKGIDEETKEPPKDDQDEKLKKDKEKENWEKLINKENKIINQITSNNQIKIISYVLTSLMVILIFIALIYLRKRKK